MLACTIVNACLSLQTIDVPTLTCQVWVCCLQKTLRVRKRGDVERGLERAWLQISVNDATRMQVALGRSDLLCFATSRRRKSVPMATLLSTCLRILKQVVGGGFSQTSMHSGQAAQSLLLPRSWMPRYCFAWLQNVADTFPARHSGACALNSS